MRKEMFIAFVLYEYQDAHDATFFFVGVSLGRAEHSLAGPFQSKAVICTGLPGRDLVPEIIELGRDDMSPQHQGKFIAYFRVSTDKQGKSGLGLEAQRKAVLDYLNGGRWTLVQEFVDVSGRVSMKTRYTVVLSMIAGAALGNAAIQALHAQAEPHLSRH